VLTSRRWPWTSQVLAPKGYLKSPRGIYFLEANTWAINLLNKQNDAMVGMAGYGAKNSSCRLLVEWYSLPSIYIAVEECKCDILFRKLRSRINSKAALEWSLVSIDMTFCRPWTTKFIILHIYHPRAPVSFTIADSRFLYHAENLHKRAPATTHYDFYFDSSYRASITSPSL
jgi:hypothetical protein